MAQARAAQARVLVIGAGGLGSPVLTSLTAAGVGHLTLLEPDRVELSNLQRQTLYTTEDVGRPKAEAARERLLALNPEVQITALVERATAENVPALARAHSVVIDATDELTARAVIHDACRASGKPYIYGAVDRFEGRVAVFAPGGACLHCLHPAAASVGSCAETGVLGVVPTLVGTLQATEALKLIGRVGRPLTGRLLAWDALTAEFSSWEIPRRPDCLGCGAATQAGAEAPVPAAALYLDVRAAHELAQGMIPGARHIPLSQLTNLDADRETRIVVYCQRGHRSRSAAELLRQTGFTNVQSLDGGFAGFLARGGVPTC